MKHRQPFRLGIALLAALLARAAMHGQLWGQTTSSDSTLTSIPSSYAAQPLNQSPSYYWPPAYAPLGADVPRPLPPVDGVDSPYARLASFPSETTEPLLGDSSQSVLIPEAQQPKKPQGRPGFFQRVNVTATYLPQFGDDGVGFVDTEVYAIFALPCPTRDSPLLIKPGTDAWFVEATANYDLPNSLHDDYLELRWLSKITEYFGVDLAITPGWHSDYQNSSSEDAYRTVAHGVGAYDWSPTLTIALGIVYLDRDDVQMLPAGGLIWTPNEDTRYEIVTPRPRIARRFRCNPINCSEDWIYLAGEFGGGQWAVERAGGVDDVLTMRDYRLILGVERKSTNLGLSGRAEIGYVFGRALEYRSGIGDIDPPDTMMARLGVWY